MKDITISGKTLRREMLIVLGCFIVAVGVNVYSIIKYRTPFSEIFTQIGYTLILTLALLIVVTLIRLIVCLIKRIFIKK
ncbi:MAG: hypothetical protein MJY56_04965 [Bacteroidales bacterium]|nr:hypothetical protein [Bacteroidales bacterium]